MTNEDKILAIEVLKEVTQAASKILGPKSAQVGDIADAALTLAQDYLRAGKDPVGEIAAVRAILPSVRQADAAADAEIDRMFPPPG